MTRASPKPFACIATILACLPMGTQTFAQDYPDRPVRWVVPFAPGGGPDVVARLVGQKLSDHLGQQVVIDNRAGAGGNVGTGLVAKSTPDGYTLLLGIASPMAINVTLYGDRLPYHPAKDFAPISMIVKVPQVLLAHPSVPARNLKELIALAKAHPNKLDFGSGGNGTTGHLIMELFKTAADAQLMHIPFRTSGLSTAAGLSGEVDLVIGSIATFNAHIKSGRLRPIAVSSGKRSPALPDTPTMMESGLKDFDVQSWYCLVAPAGTPRPVVDKVRAALIQSLEAPEVQQRLRAEGGVPEASTPEELDAFIRSEIVKWGAAVKASGAKID